MGSEDNPAEPAPGASLAPSRVGAYLYPWDLLGDPDAVPRLVEAGFEHVTVAAAYHGVRAATPQHPQHRFVVAETAALYRPVRDSTWGARRLRPFGAPGRAPTTRSGPLSKRSMPTASVSAPGWF